jgi:uncharacterized cupredoxin-like copper-binding protein
MEATDLSTPDHHRNPPKGTPMQHSKRTLLITASAALLGAATLVRAHTAHAKKKASAAVWKEQTDWGIAGDAKNATRTIDCKMLDTMRFSPERIDAKLDETIRFRMRNTGRVMHEFVIGTRAENAKHYEYMKKFPNMEHDEPWMAHVPPGKTAEIVWKFNRPGDFEFACLIAGHYEAGMVGGIAVRSA